MDKITYKLSDRCDNVNRKSLDYFYIRSDFYIFHPSSWHLGLVFNGMESCYKYDFQRKDKFNFISQQIEILATFLYDSNMSAEGVSSEFLQRQNYEDFKLLVHIFKHHVSFKGTFPEISLVTNFKWFIFKRAFKINGKRIICDEISYNFSKCELNILGKVNGRRVYETKKIDSKSSSLFKKVLKAYYRANLKKIVKNLDLSFEYKSDTIAFLMSKGYLTKF